MKQIYQSARLNFGSVEAQKIIVIDIVGPMN